MKKFFVFSCLFFSVLAFAKNGSPQITTIGFIPGEDPQWLKKNGVKLAQVLQEKLNTPVKIYISKNYEGLTQAMKAKKVDFAFFSALTFVEAEKSAGAKVLLKKVWDGPFYYSALVTLDPKIKSIEDLKGKRIGWVDEQSASGHLYPQVMFLKKGLKLDTFFREQLFFGQHEASVKALLAGKVDVIAVFSDDPKGKSGAWDRFAPQEKDKFKIMWVSEPIPNDPFCVRQDFYDEFPKFTHDMMFALIEFRDEPAEKNILKSLYGIKSLELATSKQYDPVRELVKYIKIGGN